jgi:hypothetical protein
MLLRMTVAAQNVVAQRVNFTPDFNAIPGAGPVQQLINGIGAFALLLSLVGIIIGGAAAALVNWAFSLGQTA